MTFRWQRPLWLPGLTSAVLFLAPPSSSQAGESPAVAAALEASDVTTGHLFNAFLYLPVGLLCAAVLLEYFAQWKKNREVEPGILFLLFGAAGSAVGAGVLALAFSPAGRETGELSRFVTWMGVVAGVIGLAFCLKRMARTRKLFSLQPIPALSGRIVVPRTAGGKGLIVGYRTTLAVAVLAALLGLSEMPLSHAQTKSVAAAMRSVLIAQAPPSAPASPSSDSEPTPAPAKPEATVVAPSLADLLAKRGPDTPDPAKSLAATANASIQGTLPATPTPTPTTPPTSSPPPEPVAGAPPAIPPRATPPPATPPPATPPPATPPPATPPPATPPPATPPAASTPAATMPAIATVPKLDKAFFAAKIKPIFDSKCTTCHGASKQKGELRLDSVAMVKAGAKGHPIVVPGNPDTSSLYLRLTSTDDEDIMPPKEKGGPLPAPIIAAVKAWILAGADFGDGTAAAAPTATAPRPGGKIEEARSKNLPPPDPATIAALTSGGAVVRPMSANGALLDINLSHFEGGPVKLAALAPIAKNVYLLDLTKTRLKDDDLAPISQMSNLTRLELKRNMITDAGLVHLKGLLELESLNLFDTQVTDTGLEQLAGLKKLQKLFLFNTKCTPAGADKLKSHIPALVINLGD